MWVGRERNVKKLASFKALFGMIAAASMKAGRQSHRHHH